MKNIFLCAALTIVCVISAFAQPLQLIRVKDLTTLEPIPGASIYISANNIELNELIGITNNRRSCFSS